MNSRFGPPIDMSDLLALQSADQRQRRSVFVGRVSTKDNQDPTLSIPRQVALASERLEEGEEFVAFYWDVESGMLAPEQRGLGPREMYEALAVPVPRDGGLQDLLERVETLGVTHALAERSDRVARAMLTSLTVEHELERLGVEVVYANEPTGGTESGRLRSRRYGQVDAEVYRATMLEMSMRKAASASSARSGSWPRIRTGGGSKPPRRCAGCAGANTSRPQTSSRSSAPRPTSTPWWGGAGRTITWSC